jgi:hypothetical protein
VRADWEEEANGSHARSAILILLSRRPQLYTQFLFAPFPYLSLLFLSFSSSLAAEARSSRLQPSTVYLLDDPGARMATLTQSAVLRLPGPSWDEEVVPALRKRTSAKLLLPASVHLTRRSPLRS